MSDNVKEEANARDATGSLDMIHTGDGLLEGQCSIADLLLTAGNSPNCDN